MRHPPLRVLSFERRRTSGCGPPSRASPANALWVILLLPAALFVVQRSVIEREERYLERKFSEEDLRYKAQVRRWI